MQISNKVIMRGDWNIIWQLSSEIENWPHILPHYRKVEIVEHNPARNCYTADMCAWRDVIPCSWRSNQYRYYAEDPARARIIYHHIKGVTKGMEVEWRFRSTGKVMEYEVEIVHKWKPSWSLFSDPGAYVINNYIVHNIADKTLNTIKKMAEAQFYGKIANRASVG
jgi:ribosome-associated toxin RatA of RatAB toxin-antitoxin module